MATIKRRENVSSLFMKLRWFWHNFDYILVCLLAVIFFVSTAAFNYYTQEPDYIKFLSPDETANYFFAHQYAETGEIAVFEPANLVAEEIVHPRSIRSDHGWLKPVSFLGIILVYGKIGSILGTAVIPYLTPFFGALGLLFFYGLIRRLFDRQIALISAFLLASFPVYFFYTARSLFHNILFVVFLLGASYFFTLSVPLKNLEKRNFLDWHFSIKSLATYLWSFLAGIFVGGAVGARTSELLWLAPALFIAFLFYARRLNLLRLVLIAAGALLAILPVFYWNQILYSSPFYGGYGEMNKSITELSQAGGQLLQSAAQGNFTRYQALADTVVKNIFYFGYQPYQSLKMFFYYVVAMFPELCVSALFGILIFTVKVIRRPKRWVYLYLLSWLVISVILVFYYGSWKFNDNPDPRRFTIGNSYTRYWLPMYIMALPFVAIFIAAFARLLARLLKLKPGVAWRSGARKCLLGGVVILLLGVWIFKALMFTVFGSEEGLLTLYYNHFIDKSNAGAILSATSPESIIVTQYHDKQLFPERRVVNSLLTNDSVNASLGRLLQNYPVYYYNFAFPEKDFRYLNERRLPPFGFILELRARRGSFALYQLKIFNSSSTISAMTK